MLERPAERDEAAATTQGWLDRPNTWVPVPADRDFARYPRLQWRNPLDP